MGCPCGYREFTLETSGGVVCAASATPTSDTEHTSGGSRAGGSATVAIPTHTWDSFTAVYHLTGTYSGLAEEVIDSTANARHGQGDGANGLDANVPTQANGVFFHSQAFDSNDYITLPEDDSPDDTSYSVSLWAKIEGRYLERMFFSRGITQTLAAPYEGWSIQLGHTPANLPKAMIQVVGSDDWERYTLLGDTALTEGCWYHLALTLESGSLATLYVDGVAVDTATISETHLAPSVSGSYIGRVDNLSYTDGNIQEVRISPVARESAWIEAEFANLCDSDFYSIGDEQ